MSSRSKSAGGNLPRASILLLEEYDALASAIGSALKKFAPQQGVVVARSLAEAEKLAAESELELFVIDVDPPWTGLTNFLEKMRSTHAGARVLVIGGAIPVKIANLRGRSGALQFIEKPFDLAAFGATVQALLGPWREQEGPGTLSSLNALDVILVHSAAGSNVVVELRSRARHGEFQIGGGQVLHAATDQVKGEGAFFDLLNWPKPRVSEKKLSGSPRRTITNWVALALEALGETEAKVSEGVAPRPESIPAETSKKIVVIDDTEMLLVFVEDILKNAEPNWQISTARNANEALEKIQSLIPDLVLLDYSLPDFNGDELCERLLQDDRTAEVPVLMMSGHVSEMNAAAPRLPNVVAKIEKPFFSDALVDLVRRTVELEHSFERELAEPEPLAPATVETEPRLPPIPELEKEILPEPAKPRIISSALAPVERHIEREARISPSSFRVAPSDGNAAVLGVFLEVLSMQLTSQLQMGAIRARPASLIASLRLESATARSAVSQIGFQLGPAKLNAEGRITSLRLLPSAMPFQPAQTWNSFEIGGVALIPNETRARVQLTPAGTTPMTMELLAHLELNSVELSSNFQVAQLILNWNTNVVRVTLNPKAPEQTAARFELRVLKLDDTGRIAELILHPSSGLIQGRAP